jgi:protein-S-isoprenylcysteine O-methyltransferase Ste14
MKLACPTKKQLKCLLWEKAIVLLVIFLAVYATVTNSFNHTGTVEVILSITATAAVFWCLWVVRTFHDMMTWWVDIQRKVDGACNLLTETKQDLTDIKQMSKPQVQ